MPPPTAVHLLALEPDLGRYMTAEERAAAERLAVPARDVPSGPLDVEGLLGGANAFGAFIVNGMLLHHVQIADQLALRLLGPGDILSLSEAPPSLLTGSDYVAAAPTRVAMLGNEVLVAARHWPRFVAGLHVRMSEQGERLGTQLAICQLPRVDQRLPVVDVVTGRNMGPRNPPRHKAADDAHPRHARRPHRRPAADGDARAS